MSAEFSKHEVDNTQRSAIVASGAADWSHDQLSVILNHTMQAVVVLDAHQRVIKAFRGGLNAWGMTANEALGRNSIELVHRDDLEYLLQLWNDALSRPGESLTFEARVIRDGKQWRWAEGTVKNLLADPEIGGVVYIFNDCHDRKQLELRSQASELRFKSLVQTFADAIVGVDQNQTVIVWNSAAEEMFGYSEDEMVGQHLGLLLPQNRRDNHLGLVEAFAFADTQRRPMATGDQMAAVRKDGSTFPIEVGLAKVPFGEDTMLLATVRDISERVSAVEELRKAGARFRTLTETAFESLVVIDKHGIISYVGGPSPTSLGFLAEEFVGRPVKSIISVAHPDDRDSLIAEYDRTSREPGVRSVIAARFLHRDRSWRWLQISSRNLYDDESVAGLVINLRDVTTERSALEELSRSSDRFRFLADLSFDGIMVINDQHEIVYRGGPSRTSLGYDKHELVKTSVISLIDNAHPDDHARVRAEYDRVMAEPGSTGSLEARFKHLDGSWRWLSAVMMNLFHEEAVEGLVVSTSDITAQTLAKAELKHQAFHDSLTGLPNRSLLFNRLEHALARSDRNEEIVGLLFLDLDRFKDINDTLGHGAGDQLLIGVAERLQTVVRDSDTLARLGGDEFVVLGEKVAGTEELFTLAERMLESLVDPIEVDGQDFFTSASIGLAVSINAEQDAGTLMRNADAAMYRAKRRGRNRIEAYDVDLQARLEHRISTESALRGALERNEFTLHYQPIFNINSAAITGVEALIRWNHPSRGLVPPDDFIPIAEETDLIRSIGDWVTRSACQQVFDWNTRLGADLSLAVNISAKELINKQLPASLAEAIDESGMDAERLCLEITETALIDQPLIAISNLSAIRAQGIKIALDDFGTGYASLAYLSTLPITQIKVDKSFTSGLGTRSNDTTIVESTIALAHGLGVSVVAEGVETELQMEHLKLFGCVHAQGYLLARPQTAKELESLLTEAARARG